MVGLERTSSAIHLMLEECAMSPVATRKKAVRPARRSSITKNTKLCVADLLRARMEREQKLNAKRPATPLTEKLTPITAVARDRVGISVWTLRHMASEGRLNYRRIGRRLFISESEIARIAGNEVLAVNAA
jgi:hypothetical protein